jgi:hypothetical protein
MKDFLKPWEFERFSALRFLLPRFITVSL